MTMKFKKIFSAVLVFMFAVCTLSALSVEVNYNGELREPDIRKRRDDDLVGVIIRTNVEAEVFINGHSFGKTPVATIDLSTTYYNLEIRRSGYDTIRCKIYPRRRYTYTYEFVMQKTCGYINIKNYPSGSTVYVNGSSVSSLPVEVDPGYHNIKVRKFGYEDYVERVYVENHKTTNVNVSLKTAPFRITNFSVSKKQINPDYSSGIGKVTFSFEVSNDGSAILSVCDRYGNAVWTHEYGYFSTWNQSITWNGTGNYGERLPDGQYTVNLYSFDYDVSYNIKIDRSLVYPLSVFTPAGSGIGSLPCAFGDGVNYVKLLVDFGPMLNLNDGKVKLYSLPVTTGILIDFGHYNEFGFSFGVGAATSSDVTDRTPLMAGISFKRNFVIDLGGGSKFDFAGLINYNYCSVYDYCVPGTEVGKGLDLGLALGYETKTFYLGVSGEYAFGATRIRTNKDRNADDEDPEDILKYGVVASLLPARNLRTSAFAAFYNNKMLEAGLEFIAMPGAGAFCCNAKASVLTDITAKDKNMLINAKFGLSYLF